MNSYQPPEPEAFGIRKAANPSLLQLAVQLLTPSSLAATPTILGVDAFRLNTLDYPVLKANGVEFLCAKATQGNYRIDSRFLTHTNGALAANMIPGGYHWNDPLVPDVAQAGYFLTTIESSPAKFIWLDVEQEWSDWGEWSLAVQGKGRITKFIHPERISESAWTIANWLKSRTALPIIVYTRTSFVLEYARPMLSWLGMFPVCLAQYPYATGRVKLTWDELKVKWWPKITPKLPPGVEDWCMHQFSGDKFVLPASDTPVDLDLFNGSLADLQAFVGLEPPPPPTDTWYTAVTTALRSQGYQIPDPPEGA